MAKPSEKPDFVVDPFGNVEDVRQLKRPKAHPVTPARQNKEQPANSLASKLSAGVEVILVLAGVILIVGGLVLYFGNTTGRLPTFPYAGCLIQFVGWMILAVIFDTAKKRH